MLEMLRNSLAYLFSGAKDCFYGVFRLWQLEKIAAEETPAAVVALSRPRRPQTVLEQRRAASAPPPPPAVAVQKKPKSKPKLSTLLMTSFCWNCILVVVVYSLIQYLVIPFMAKCAEIFFELIGSSDSFEEFWWWADFVIKVMFHLFYIIPMIIISRVTNTFIFQDIANMAWKVSKHKSRPPTPSIFIADLVYSVILQTAFLGQSCLSALIPLPLIGTVVNLVHLSLLYSMYAFEYRWMNQGIPLNVRIDKLQNQWPYFVGFGLPLAYLTNMADNFIISGALFAVIFPVMIIGAHEAPEIRQNFDVSLKIFCVVIRVSDFIFKKAPIVFSVFYVFIKAVYGFGEKVVQRLFSTRPKAKDSTK